MVKNNTVRRGCVDIWNAFMVQDAAFSLNDIPFSPVSTDSIPEKLIAYDEAMSSNKCFLIFFWRK